MCFLIDWIALIGRDPNPVRNPVYKSKSMKNSICTRTLLGPVRPVGPTDQTGRSLPDKPQCLDQSDRSPCRTATIRRTLTREGPRRGKRA